MSRIHEEQGRVAGSLPGNPHPSPRGRLEGKVAVVTGASKGIGASVALHLAAEGAAVVVHYASGRDGADRIVAEIEGARGRARAVQADLSKPADVERLFRTVVEEFGRVDVLVNNAGVYEFAPLGEVTPEHFHRIFDLNVLGLLLATKAAVPHFPAGGGSIVNIGSVAGTSPFPETSVYSASKAAVDVLTRTLAQELGAKGIRVNALNPGMIDTEGVRAAGILESDLRTLFEERTPLQRIGRPSDVARVAVFLASAESGWVTGESLIVSGGMR